MGASQVHVSIKALRNGIRNGKGSSLES